MTGQSKLIMMMSDEDILDKRYENGKIYTIKHPKDDKVYVGSTIRTLNNRFGKHKKDYDCCLYKYVNGNFDGWYIELYENYPCKNKYILLRREGEVTKLIGSINTRIAGRKGKEWYEDNKEKVLKRCEKYREDNKEKLAEYSKEYREANKDKISQYKKQYRQDNKDKIAESLKQYYQDNKDKLTEYKKQHHQANKDKIAERRKQYYEANKDRVLEFNRQKVICDRCGFESNRSNLPRHKKTAKCINFNPTQK